MMDIHACRTNAFSKIQLECNYVIICLKQCYFANERGNRRTICGIQVRIRWI
jgi:hypothetical protein